MPYSNGRALSALSDVARTLLVTEGDAQWEFTEAPLQNGVPGFGDNMFKGHLGTVNFLFADGHVKAMKPSATGNPTNMWNIEETADNDSSLMLVLNDWTSKLK